MVSSSWRRRRHAAMLHQYWNAAIGDLALLPGCDSLSPTALAAKPFGLNRQYHLIQPLQILNGTRNDADAEQTLSNQPMPKALRDWMREERTPLAAHWNLLTKLDPAMVSRSMKSRVQ